MNPLLGGQLAWSQTPDQLYASRVDSGNTNDDLYRTTYVYDDRGQLTHTSSPAFDASPDYPTAVESAPMTVSSTTLGAAPYPGLLAYYRLDETTGTATDTNGSGVGGTHTAVTQ